ncbi:MAG: hypothetical protein ACHQRM_05020 [Bacteroidia bacterium]
MQENRNHITPDQLFQQAFAGFETEPAPAVWAGVEKALDEESRKRPVAWWVWGLMLLMLVAGTEYWLWTRQEGTAEGSYRRQKSGDLVKAESQSQESGIKSQDQKAETERREEQQEAKIRSGETERSAKIQRQEASLPTGLPHVTSVKAGGSIKTETKQEDRSDTKSTKENTTRKAKQFGRGNEDSVSTSLVMHGANSSTAKPDTDAKQDHTDKEATEIRQEHADTHAAVINNIEKKDRLVKDSVQQKASADSVLASQKFIKPFPVDSLKPKPHDTLNPKAGGGGLSFCIS